MSLIERVKSILLKPRETWPVIAAESTDVASIYTGYVMILAAIPAVALFIGFSVIGMSGFGFSYRIPIVAGLLQMVVGYVLSLVMLFVLALIVDALAPTFGGVKNQVQALKLVAYSMTAYYVGGIFNLIPALAILGLLAGLYSIWLMYTGVATLMRSPPEKSAAYTAVIIVCAIIAGIVISVVTGLFLPRMGGVPAVGSAAGIGAPGAITIKGSDGAAVTIDTSSMEAMAKRMEEAGKRAEAAQKSGDPAAAGKAAADMLAAMTGSTAAPIPAADLKAMLPEAVGDLKRTSFESSGGEAMGIAGSTAKAVYGTGEKRIELSIVDTGGLAGMATMAGWANMTMDKETDGKVEKVYKDNGRTVHEEYRKDGSQTEVSTILGNGVIVAAEGRGIDIAGLKKIVAGVDLARLETMKRAAK